MPTISKRVRFELFKRDEFTCQYCGRKPPQVILHADHIIPKSKQGRSTIDNLVTSCLDCNLGKSNIPLSSIPETLQKKIDRLKEQREQLRAFNKFQENIEADTARDVEEITALFTEIFPGKIFTDQFKQASLRTFLSYLPKTDILNALRAAAGKMLRGPKRKGLEEDTIKYFCGICWKTIKRARGDA
jgi:DNA-directed RNA polymerase subunit RPC12/RpoP